MSRKCPTFFGVRRCPTEKLKRNGKIIAIPTEKVASAGQVAPEWWCNGGYAVEINEQTFWHLCLEDKRGVGHNAVVKVLDKESKGVVWKDVDNEGCNIKDLVKVVRELLERQHHEGVAKQT